MQEMSLVLWSKFQELEEPDGFRNWALAVARYESLAWRRDKARDRLVLAADVLGMIAVESAEQARQLSEQRDALEVCLEKLPLAKRSLVLVAYEPDVCIQEVAKQSGRTVAAFYQWLHRMRMRLRECARRTLEAEALS
ncbi:RNA polymerase, sigma-24 subunit, ECF subfamily [Rhodopirellula sp. SWK7]|nr:RNA polymerase, sigma-24 subunit, ECF subfamily [Rhodopirellula sp. SWK7]